MLRLLSLLGIAAFAAAIPVATQDDLVVQTKSGAVRGFYGPNSRQFLGIRYAAPPGRWEDSVPPTPWQEVFNATDFSVGCLQRCHLPPGTCPPKTSEDCLFLSVVTPRTPAPPGGFPVMVFFHGGRFEQGYAGGDLYNGDFFGADNVVLVLLNYRLNIFGFLANSEFAGNYGLKDQQLALRWVQDNIAGFSGNPQQVTIFGQSAGGGSISAHLLSPKSEGLYHRAILMSNPWSIRLRETKDAHSYAAQIARKLNCPIKGKANVECMRKQTPDALFDAYTHVTPFPEPHPLSLVLRWTPLVDGELVLGQPMQMIRDKKVKTVPLMMGNVYDDGLLFIYQLSAKPIPKIAYQAANVAVFGKAGLKALAEYPDKNATDGRESLAVETTDAVFECCSRWVIDSLLETNPSTPYYLYRYDHIISWDAFGPEYPYCVGRVCHGSEVPILFGAGAMDLMTAEEKTLSTSFRRYFTQFASTPDANPNYAGGVEWKSYNPQSRDSILIKPVSEAAQNVKKQQCDFWDAANWYQKE